LDTDVYCKTKRTEYKPDCPAALYQVLTISGYENAAREFRAALIFVVIGGECPPPPYLQIVFKYLATIKRPC